MNKSNRSSTKRRKIYINGRFLTQSISGVQRYAHEFIQSLDTLIEQKAQVVEEYEFEILAPRWLNQTYQLELKHINIRKAGFLSGHLWEQFELPFYSMRGILFCPCNLAPILHLLSYHKTVVTIHDLSYKYFPDAYSRRFRLIYNILVPLIFKLADLIVTVSNSELHFLKKYYPAAAAKLHAVQNGGLPDRVKIDTIKEITDAHTKPYILYVGALNPRKNPQGVIAAYNILKNKKDIDLLIVGSATHSFTQIPYSTGRLSDDKIIFTGQIENTTQLIIYYQHAACLVFPSFYEASPLPPIEAMACQCPVIVSNIPSLRERCGEAALYCDPQNPDDIAEKIYCVTEDVNLRNELIEKGIEQAKKYTWNRCVENTMRRISRLFYPEIE